MVIETKVKLSGIWRVITQPEVMVGGVQREITTIEVKSGGVWREVFAPVVDVFNLSGTAASPRSQSQTSTPAVAEWIVAVDDSVGTGVVKGEMTSAGYVTVPSFSAPDPLTDWVIPHDFNTTYFYRLTYESGNQPTVFEGFGVWRNLVPEGTSRSFKWRRLTTGTLSGVVKVEIALDGLGVTIVATGFYEGTVTVP